MENLEADVVVIGLGHGRRHHRAGARPARGRRAGRRAGERLPREPENWSPRAVFIDRRYKPAERWLDGAGVAFAPGVHYVVGGNTQGLRREPAAVPGGATSGRSSTSTAPRPRGRSATPTSSRTTARRSGSTRVHGSTGEDPTEPWRSTPFPYPALPHEPYVADLAERLRAAGRAPSADAHGRGHAGGRARASAVATCDGFPCLLGAKADAETCALDPALATGRAGWPPGCACGDSSPMRTGRRVGHVVAAGRTGRSRHGRPVRAVGGRGRTRRRCCWRRRRRAPRGAGELLGPGRPQLHDARQRAPRRGRPATGATT